MIVAFNCSLPCLCPLLILRIHPTRSLSHTEGALYFSTKLTLVIGANYVEPLGGLVVTSALTPVACLVIVYVHFGPSVEYNEHAALWLGMGDLRETLRIGDLQVAWAEDGR